MRKESKHTEKRNVYRKVFSVFFILLTALIFGCHNKKTVGSDNGDPIVVFAAASMTNVVEELAGKFTKEEKISVLVNTASSSTLARQIEQGSGADIYFSANKKWADYLLERELLESDSVVVVAKNSLVIISPLVNEVSNMKVNLIKNRDSISADFLSSGRIAVGDPDHVPAGMYAKEALSSLGVYAAVEDRLIPCASVRDALLLTERNEADWGIVYKTDALSSKKVFTEGEFSGELHTPIKYFLGIVSGNDENENVEKFYRYCLSEEGQAIYEKYGFSK